ncbi:MAG: agmatine deiminase family protein [Candidatus Auribacterota bacterium]|nr:agmatine deiminase family protein [Candidatus Auribacterota bacterium]
MTRISNFKAILKNPRYFRIWILGPGIRAFATLCGYALGSLALIALVGACGSSSGRIIDSAYPVRNNDPTPPMAAGNSDSTHPVRIPAEWEKHKATWMQWPRAEEAGMRRNFSAIIAALRKYEPINILVESNADRRQAEIFLTEHGVPLSHITWHIMPYDWAWMRDNGPVWSVKSDEQIVQNWGFNGWGLGPPYADDDAVPCRVAAIEGRECKTHPMINEGGNLEFNGAGALIANWVCQRNRNPGVTRAETETLFRRAFGLTRIVWLLSEPSDDITNGHVDGIARFIDEDTVAVARYVSHTDPDAPVYEEAAAIIKNAGFEVVRVDMPGYVMHNGYPLPANYLNWLVANGVVIVPRFGVPAWDAAARATIAGFFPDRDVVMVEILDIWAEGGGVHCVTNNQPVPLATSSTTDSRDYNGDGTSDIAIFRGSSGL